MVPFPETRLDITLSLISDLLESIERGWPSEVRQMRYAVLRAESSQDLETTLKQFSELTIAESRNLPSPDHDIWSSARETCKCVLCGDSVAARQGIKKHLKPYRNVPCRVMSSLVLLSHERFKKKEAYKREMEALRELGHSKQNS